MAWRAELAAAAERELDRIDLQTARRIPAFLHGRVAQLDGLPSIDEAFKGSMLGEFWKYRVGDCRIIASIEDGALGILVVGFGNWRDVYQ